MQLKYITLLLGYLVKTNNALIRCCKNLTDIVNLVHRSYTSVFVSTIAYSKTFLRMSPSSSSSQYLECHQVAADKVGQWTASNKMVLNYDKMKELRICFKKSTPDIALLTIDGRPIQQVNSTRLLGVTLSEDLKWQSHIDEITIKASQRLYFIILLKRAGIDPHHLINIYTSIVRSVLEYACQVWHTSLTKKANKTDRIHPETGNEDHFPR